MAGGILSPDGKRWYGLRATTTSTGELVRVELRTLVFHDGAVPSASSLTIPTEFNYFTLLLAPDGRTLYAVDYRTAETIHMIDVDRNAVVRSVALRRQGSKAPVCASTLSPRGDRLYLTGRDGDTGDGIDVVDPSSLRRVAHFFPGRDFYCVAVSADGTRLYASAAGSIVTIDTRTGRELQTVAPPATKKDPAYLILAVSRE